MAYSTKSIKVYDFNSSDTENNNTFFKSRNKKRKTKSELDKTTRPSYLQSMESYRNFMQIRRQCNVSTSKSKIKKEYSSKLSNTNYSWRDVKKNTLPQKNKLDNQLTKIHKNDKNINLDKQVEVIVESSSDSDFPDLKYLKYYRVFPKNKTLLTSSPKTKLKSIDTNLTVASSKETIFKKNTSIDCKTSNVSKQHIKSILNDCSLSDVLVVRKDFGERDDSVAYNDYTNFKVNSITPNAIPLNISLSDYSVTIPKEPSVVAINVPELFAKDSDVKQKNQLSKLKDKSAITSRHATTAPEICRIKKSKKRINKPSTHVLSSNNNLSILKIKRPTRMNKSNQSISDKMDIGLEYNVCNDMVELENGTLVPAFLATLNPKITNKTLCACGISSSEVPLIWTESFHEMLHKNVHKLNFKGNIPNNGVINIKESGLSYFIVKVNGNLKNEKLETTIQNVNDFVNLEYGILEQNFNVSHSVYLAVIPSLKVIGFLAVEPKYHAFKFVDNKLTEDIVPIKFGVLKIWISINYRSKQVDTNLMNFFLESEKICKNEIAFTLSGCEGVEFVKSFIENENILIYT
ncbi:uncharacterized protein LOC126835014 [Adelges cooleyi]|uniref:uncharacterized protein LOC126835014 n=1 Tax=Adelges cooleyi TaxID=133065 RepID=UPI00217FCDDD|nr:uncharacterized protein LOC126835014 [Adelges cooleyi]XP_050423242.1 uncharacterized protein LOC126835014 [Adelges cooleyi]XP_050423243.1 uncharacterized protein LOC126835014 [Adelges cooleyi]